MTDPARDLDARGTGPFDPPGIEWTRVSPRLITARLLSVGITLAVPAVAAIVLAILFPHWWQWLVLGVLVLLGLWAVVLVPRQVRASGPACTSTYCMRP